MINQVILLDNDNNFIKKLLEEIKKIDSNAIFDINYFPSLIRIKIQVNQDFRSKIFNKLHYIHSFYGLTFKPTQFIKKDKSLITFDLLC